MRGNLFPTVYVTLVTLIATLSGDYVLGVSALGWAAALILLVFIAYYKQYTREQFIVSLTWYLLLLLCRLTNFPWGVIMLIISLALGLYIGILSVVDMFANSRVSLVNYVGRYLLGELQERQVLATPKKGFQDTPPVSYGPRLVIIQPQTAATMVRGGTLTRIVGPGIYLTEKFEYVEHVFNLRPLHRTYHLQDVLTSEQLTVAIDISITYCILVTRSARFGERALRSVEINHLRRLSSWAVDWETLLHEIVDKNTRSSVGRRELRTGLDVEVHQAIQDEILRRTQSDVAERGLYINELYLLSIQPDSNIIRISSENWLVALRNDILVQQEGARGRAWATAINAIATAYSEVSAQGLPDSIVYRELVRRLFEQASLDPGVKALLQSELARMLSNSVERSDVEPER